MSKQPLASAATPAVDIHLCEASEVPRLRAFLDRHWAKDHVLARDRALLDWQHRRGDGRYNVIVATRPDDDELLGVLGFIPTNRYDPALSPEESVVWLALWKVRSDAAPAGLGLALLRYLTSLHEGWSVGVVGIGPPQHGAMYRALGFTAGELTQYYALNERRGAFGLAQVPRDHQPKRAAGSARLTPIARSELEHAGTVINMAASRVIARKTAAYFAARFYGHPTYTYGIYKVESPAGPALLATRVASHEGQKALRIVDFLGASAAFGEIGPEMQRLMHEQECEYADVWNHGYPPGVFEKAGFSAVDREGPVIIPSYFEPFDRRNVRIAFAIRTTSSDSIVVFRADGDQDRPNRPAA